MTNTTWIPVTVSKGIFSNEYSVSLKTNKGESVSIFANRELIKQENKHHLLKVSVVKVNSSSRIVALPVEAIETGSRWVEIKES